MSRVIYCDFDGVFHPVSALKWFEMRLPREEAIRAGGLFRWTWVLDSLLEDHQDVQIIVHSSWRQLVRHTDLQRYLGPLGNRFQGSTGQGDRWDSILQNVEQLHPSAWLVLDDHAGEFPNPPPPELLICNPEEGVWGRKVRTALETWLSSTRIQ